MIVVISGSPGVGKSTVCLGLLAVAGHRGITCGGIITTKSSIGDILIRDVATSEERILARRDNPTGGPQAGRYYFEPTALAFGVQAIQRGDSADLLFVDELGHLEIWNGGFAAAIPVLNGRDKPAVVVIREQLLDALIPRFTQSPLVMTVNIENRDALPAQVLAKLFPPPV